MFREGQKVWIDSNTIGTIKTVIPDPQSIKSPFYLVEIDESESLKLCQHKDLKSLDQMRQEKLDKLFNI